MGRGRQKAKQTKVARKLKYFSPETDYAALERELGARRDGSDDLGSWDSPQSSDDDWDDTRP
ncbi:conserved hypothetical protein [Actinomycetales bacterium JB111]|jgi:hypothetical protein|nr:conserved hypothetical protein [Actinomycetales bacterium JB111]